ncbi:zinc-dependent metalloprotease [Sediminibacterium sp.]|uniref:zinc-dependent metalloprotease n=1 Tax=Sediminibacterium sp. TaxID=1917865 RepID=UPI0027349B1A|nr:zinc-dependent metalloprotease [Sediminibacterium sp.]MDP3394953.1 zinc-dependent metalloprotease [Sediminibacterium sp.]MDP3565579.1 zinc-dependent metalloprotease [Sediminibacterium sp.]
MKRYFLGTALLLVGVTTMVHAQQPPTPAAKPAADTTKPAAPKKPTVADKTKGNKKIEGLFTVYQDTVTGSLQMYIRKDQLEKEFIYQSFSISGPTTLFLNQSMHRSTAVYKIKRAFDKLEFSEVNTNFYYDPNNPVSKSANVDKPEAVFFNDKFSVEDENGYLVSVDGLFLTEKMDPVKPQMAPSPMAMFTFNLGGLNLTKSKYVDIRSYPNNTDIVVDLSYDNPTTLASGGPDVVDPRYVRVRMQHSFLEMPKNDFRARRDDPRVGYFMQQRTNMTSVGVTPYKDMINRWFLKKKDPSAAISEPVEPIVFWVENTTPLEYRQTIVDAGLKWNEAFEKAGFKNAVQMNIMPDDAKWNPADIRYNVIRWVSSAQPSYGAIGPSFVNPRTGQILGSDITVEWYSGSATPISDELFNGPSMPQLVFPGMEHQHLYNCNIGSELKMQYTAGLTTLETMDASAAEIKEMHQQFLIYLIMHEMGHTLGLNHNMKSSQMLSPTEVHNKSITRKIGLIGSVMDYPAINVSLDRSKQGDYYTTKAGPYDIWAIEFGYTPFNETEEEAMLTKILSKSTDPKLAFGNDGDDMRAPGKAIDPRINVNDMSNDAVAYAEDRFKLVNNIMGKLIQKYTKPGQSYAELRNRYLMLQGQRSGQINAVSRYIGGVYIDRSFPEQNSTNKPYTPTPFATQKKAMDVLNKYVFAPNAFEADTQLFPYLQMQRRGFNQPGNGEDFKVSNTFLGLQVNGALAHILNPITLQRVNNTRLYGNEYSVVDIMSDLVKGIFDADINANVNVYRRYIQISFVKGAVGLIAPNSTLDEVSKSAALYTLKKLRTKLAAAVSPNEDTKAHRAHLLFLIDKALKAD